MQFARALLVVALAALGPAPLAADGVPSISITATDPGLNHRLGANEPFFVRLAYRTDRPVILRVEGMVAGKPLPGMTDGIHRVGPGAGETMAWIAYSAGTAIDGIRTNILDERSRPISALDTPAQLRWDAGPARTRAQRADWANRMNDAEQRPRPETGVSSAAQEWLGLGIMAGVPLYFVLQAWLVVVWSGRWRVAALAPMIALAPATAFSLYALSRGSNLWPLTVILLAPPGLIYLLILCGIRSVAYRGAV